MRAATSIQREASTLTPAQEAEMRRMDPNGDGIIDEKEGRAIARSSAKLRASNMKHKKGLCATLALLVLSWFGNAGLMVAVVTLSKDLKVEGVSLKTMNGGSVSTHGQKNVFEVTLTVSGRRLDEQGSGNIQGHLQEPVAQVVCKNVLLAISSIEDGDDESLVKITILPPSREFVRHRPTLLDGPARRALRCQLRDVQGGMRDQHQHHPLRRSSLGGHRFEPLGCGLRRCIRRIFDGDVRRRLNTYAGVDKSPPPPLPLQPSPKETHIESCVTGRYLFETSDGVIRPGSGNEGGWGGAA